MSKYYIGGVATVSAFSNGAHMFTAKTLTDSSINISVSNEEIRGGEGAQLLGKFFHTTVFNLSLTDALFDFEYIMRQTGSKLEDTAETVIWKTYTAEYADSQWTVDLKGDTIATLDFDGLYTTNKLIGWSDKYDLHDIELSAVVGTTKYKVDSTVGVDTTATDFCITCPISVAGAKQIKVNAMYYPAEFSLIMRAKLFAGDACKVSDGENVGEVIIEIPRFQLDGTIDLAMAMTSPATYSLNGSALANGCGCDDSPWYAKITEFIKSTDPYAGYTAIVADTDTLVAGHDFGLYAFAIGKTPKAIKVGDYNSSVATVINAVTGKVVANGTTEISINQASSPINTSAIATETIVVTVGTGA